MNRLLVFLLSIILLSCLSKHNRETNAVNETKIVSVNAITEYLQPENKKLPIEVDAPVIDYDSTLVVLTNNKAELKSSLSDGQISIDSVGEFFSNALVNHIIPYWYGTTWDFNGHTNVPNDGLIACGYFVSTTLKHLNLKLNRFKLAQQASLNIVKSLACDSKVHSYRNPNKENMMSELKSTLDDGIYIVGLSNHVGFLYLRNNELYFLHATFLEPGEVVAEIAQDSDAFMWSDVYYISAVSKNKTLMKQWLNNVPIDIVGG